MVSLMVAKMVRLTAVGWVASTASILVVTKAVKMVEMMGNEKAGQLVL